MTQDKILDRICAQLKEIVPDVAQEISPQTELRAGLGLNSLDAVDLVMSLEDEFEIELPDDELAAFETVGDVAAAVGRQIEAT